MNRQVPMLKEPMILKMADLARLTADRGLSLNPLSPLKALPPAAESLSTEGARLAADPDFGALLEVLCMPVAVVANRVGGPLADYQEMQACYRRVSGKVLVSILTDGDGAAIQTWEDSEALAAWWCGQYAQKSEEVIVNYIPPLITLEGLLTLFHCIDAYKRALFHSMLAYRPYDLPTLTPAEFTESAQAAVRSRDMRWLLPTLPILVPGFAELPLGDISAIGQEAWARNFLVTVKDRETGTESIGFGEAGRNMGMEFYRSWIFSAGFEIRAIREDGIRALSRFYVAPTAITNHFITLTLQPDGTCMANHQPCGYTRLLDQMRGLLAEVTA